MDTDLLICSSIHPLFGGDEIQNEINRQVGIDNETWKKYGPKDERVSLKQAFDPSTQSEIQNEINRQVGIDKETWEKFGPK